MVIKTEEPYVFIASNKVDIAFREKLKISTPAGVEPWTLALSHNEGLRF